MSTTPYERIQWFHGELTHGSYPNAAQLAERFGLSVRQAQRDIAYLRDELHAPLRYHGSRRGYHYTAPFSLPIALVDENHESRAHFRENGPSTQQDGPELPEAENIVIQTQIPYTAILEISDRLTVLELRSYILEEEEPGQFLCEFHGIDRFLCAILTARSAVRIREPDWLRERLLGIARRVLEKNG